MSLSREKAMQLFKTEMLFLHPPQATPCRGRRRRYGCRTVAVAPVAAQPLAAALRLALATAPASPPDLHTARCAA